MEDSDQILREKYLSEGATLIKGELEEQASYAIDLRQKVELRNVDLFSSTLLANSKVQKEVKEAVRQRGENVRKIAVATAYFIERNRFETLDAAIAKASENMSLFERQRLENLASTQRDIRLSHTTLSAVVEIFRRANTLILKDIRQFGEAKGGLRRIEKTKLYLKNAIVVHELASFVIDYLKAFSLSGVDDLKKIRDDVMSDIKKGRTNDKALEKKLGKTRGDLKKSSDDGFSIFRIFRQEEETRKQERAEPVDSLESMVLKEIDGREEVRKAVIAKWDVIMKNLEQQKRKTDGTPSVIRNLEIIRDNTSNRIDVLNLTATTILVENSLAAIDTLAATIQKLEMPAIDATMAFELLNLGEEVE